MIGDKKNKKTFQKTLDKPGHLCYTNNVERTEGGNTMDAYITDITCEEYYTTDWASLLEELAEEEEEA